MGGGHRFHLACISLALELLALYCLFTCSTYVVDLSYVDRWCVATKCPSFFLRNQQRVLCHLCARVPSLLLTFACQQSNRATTTTITTNPPAVHRQEDT